MKAGEMPVVAALLAARLLDRRAGSSRLVQACALNTQCVEPWLQADSHHARAVLPPRRMQLRMQGYCWQHLLWCNTPACMSIKY